MTTDTTDARARDVKVAAPASEKMNSDSEFSYEFNAKGKAMVVVVKSHDELERTMKPVK